MRTIGFSAALLLACLPGSLPARGDGTFRVPLRVPLLVHPTAIAAGDFNRDGRLDLAVAGPSAVEIHLQLAGAPIADRRFGLPKTITGGSSNFFLVAADLDGDGDDDLVVADLGGLGFVLTCRGDGTFEPRQTLAKSKGSRWITVGDLDQDGLPEIISANHDDISVTVYKRDAAGAYTMLQQIQTSREPHAVELAKLDGDEAPDLLVGLAQDGNILLHGRGDGTFEPRSQIKSLGCIDALTLGDLNQDGFIDVVANCEESAIKLAINQRDGTFKVVLTIPRIANDLLPPVLGDFSDDGLLDLAVAGLGDGEVRIYTEPASGELAPFAVLVPGADHTTLLASDLDGDRRTDLVSVGNSSNFAAVFFGTQGEIPFDAPLLAPGDSKADNLAVIDFDRDGIPDVVLPSSGAPGVEVIRSPGRGGINGAPLLIPFTGEVRGVAVADFDGDGLLDVAGALRGAKGEVALLDAAGAVRGAATLDSGDTLAAIHAAEVSGDGLPDVVGLLSSGDVVVFLNQGGGAFAPRTLFTTRTIAGQIFAVDLTGDGLVDLVVNGYATILIRDGLGDGAFGPQRAIFTSPRKFRSLAVADLDGDGALDLAATEPDTKSIQLSLGDGHGQFAGPTLLTVGGATGLLRAADLNGDGLVDLVTEIDPGGFAVLLNSGGGSFGPPALFPPGLDVRYFELADVNLDGALDIVALTRSKAAKFYLLLGRSAPQVAGGFIRGDVDGDGRVQVNDPILLLGRLFLGEAPLGCEDAADGDDSGALDVTDAVAIIAHLFLGAGPLPPPAGCGEDPTADGLNPCARGC